MKALIFNSGIGKRMGALTDTTHKSMVRLQNGETVFERQIRILSECGIRDFIVTTGPFQQQLQDAVTRFQGLNVTFVKNPVYDTTNYIYSMYLAIPFIDDDMLILHGDLVFNKRLIEEALQSDIASFGMVNQSLPLPQKDFKARVANGLIQEVSVHIFDENCYAFQPFYKLSKQVAKKWCKQVAAFIQQKNDQVYAENALNELLPLGIRSYSYAGNYMEEIDTCEDLQRVSSQIRQFDFDEQPIFCGEAFATNAESKIKNCSKVLVVCQDFSKDYVTQQLKASGTACVFFTDFVANPTYQNILDGLALFQKEACDGILSVGGGSAIDVAKSIKLFSGLQQNQDFLSQAFRYVAVPHICIPTTAGTGSEATTFAVFYRNGEKVSLAHDNLLPDQVVLHAKLLRTLSPYHKKSACLDALCQAIESFWSIHANLKSQAFAQKSLDLIQDNIAMLESGDDVVLQNMLRAANYSGKAINITKTTAAHAMSYKLTSLYDIAHGHAVALCMSYLWEYMSTHLEKTIDPRGQQYLETMFQKLNGIFRTKSSQESVLKFREILDSFGLPRPKLGSKDELDLLVKSVNADRLSNNPIRLEPEVIYDIYSKILGL